MRLHRLLVPAFVLLAACSGPTTRSQAQPPPLAQPTREAPSDSLNMKASFAPVVRRAAPAVVNISAKRVVRQQVDPFWQLFGMGVPPSRVEGSLGSGVIVRADGIIVTNNHVVEGGREITVALSDRREFPARVLLADPRSDLAVLKIDVGRDRLPVMPIDDSDEAQVGDLVLAIGDPFGVGQTVTNGIISALNRTADPQGGAPMTYIQTDAAINPGNSGGALVDMDGDLIGVNSFIVSRSGASAGVGFAIPAAMVRRVVEAAAGGGNVLVRSWLGARTQEVTPEIARSLSLNAPQGALVADIWPGGPADRAGLRSGDVILSVNGRSAADTGAVLFAVAAARPGESMSLGVRRGEQQLNVTLRAETPPARPARDDWRVEGRNPFQGATVVNVSPAVADELGVDPFLARGVLVINISRGFAMNAGLRPGDVVRKVNGRDIGTVSDLRGALAAPAGTWQVTILRGDREITANFRT
ncbi:MAG: Do family serine endopeptidase [Phenylobacterium sp.]|uniref:Do family serine endopeptidase n=1 Tax=Phenylobacterium sp. TaxID=1871053 RepID=UPI0025FFCE12|nr:Do family serine endopeptidase [Phenylobacterium sp.]MCA6223370.1 Do family serine endopeptidase [Phenylobacterium sp.]MCA6227345.1 Do family serine endopeptidase [Phenylobacterium sp.]MCA6232625.1 Do family serine endopeptidase [Phenylobacterium sp.]MCA6235527.1 Do family serine endopeptidase [Phenylobacterium sp.]MCA6250244.1 Do family serine endopeptidase [Phenylobacterium sp.]